MLLAVSVVLGGDGGVGDVIGVAVRGVSEVVWMGGARLGMFCLRKLSVLRLSLDADAGGCSHSMVTTSSASDHSESALDVQSMEDSGWGLDWEGASGAGTMDARPFLALLRLMLLPELSPVADATGCNHFIVTVSSVSFHSASDLDVQSMEDMAEGSN